LTKLKSVKLAILDWNPQISNFSSTGRLSAEEKIRGFLKNCYFWLSADIFESGTKS
jgi:hypothetical protein